MKRVIGIVFSFHGSKNLYGFNNSRLPFPPLRAYTLLVSCQPAAWGFVSLGSTHCECDGVFRGSLVTRWEAPGGIGSSFLVADRLFSFSTLMLLVGSFGL